MTPPQRRADVLVVGGGPAGSLTALLVARAGFVVDLIDRAHFPRPKACGEFVNPGAVQLLHRVGLQQTIAAASENVITGWRLHTDDSAVAEGRYGGSSWGIAVARSDFDSKLIDAARAVGVRVREGVSARRVSAGPVTVTLRTSRGAQHEERPTILVGADGLNSVVSRTLGGLVRPPKRSKVSLSAHIDGVGPDRERGHMFVTEGLTVGLAATGANHEWNATVVVDPERDGRSVAANPADFLLRRLASLPLAWKSEPTLVEGPWASGPFDRPVRRLAGEGFVLVGDASGYYDPLTGQGIYRALRSAELAAPRIAEALHRPARAAAALSAYARDVNRDRRGGRAVQRAVEHVMSTRRLRRWTVRRLADNSSSLDALLRVTGDMDGVGSLARPSVWWPILRRSA